MYKDVINRLISFPQRGQIKIDFDLKKKVFSLSAPIFSSRDIPESIKKYVESRKNMAFKPYTTSFQLKGNHIFVNQEIPFQANFQETLRGQIDAFRRMSVGCHRMLAELAIEEEYKNALHLGLDRPF